MFSTLAVYKIKLVPFQQLVAQNPSFRNLKFNPRSSKDHQKEFYDRIWACGTDFKSTLSKFCHQTSKVSEKATEIFVTSNESYLKTPKKTSEFNLTIGRCLRDSLVTMSASDFRCQHRITGFPVNSRFWFYFHRIQHTRLPIDPYFDNDMTSSYMIYRFLPFRNLEVEKIGQNNGIREK